MSPSLTKGTRDDFICLYASKETKKIDVKVSLTLPLTATSMSASSKTMQGAFPPSSKETYKISFFGEHHHWKPEGLRLKCMQTFKTRPCSQKRNN